MSHSQRTDQHPPGKLGAPWSVNRRALVGESDNGTQGPQRSNIQDLAPNDQVTVARRFIHDVQLTAKPFLRKQLVAVKPKQSTPNRPNLLILLLIK